MLFVILVIGATAGNSSLFMRNFSFLRAQRDNSGSHQTMDCHGLLPRRNE
jgi:hypothetical protein